MACGCCSGRPAGYKPAAVAAPNCKCRPLHGPAACGSSRCVARSGGDRAIPSGHLPGQLAAAPIAALCRLLSERSGDSGGGGTAAAKGDVRLRLVIHDPRNGPGATKADCLNRLLRGDRHRRGAFRPTPLCDGGVPRCRRHGRSGRCWACLMRPLAARSGLRNSSRSEPLVQRHGGW